MIPHPDDDSLLHVKGTIDDALAWSRKIDEFLARKETKLFVQQQAWISLFLAYRTPHPNRQKCDYNNPPAPGKSCDFDLTKLGFCSSENNYGFSKGSPCVFLKLRKTPSWTPEYLNASDVPSDLPEDLKYHLTVGHDRKQVCGSNLIKFDESSNKYLIKQKAVLLSCHGDYPADAENIGPISFFPSRSFYDYQISNEEGSLEPIIAILFEQPTSKFKLVVNRLTDG